MKPGNLNPNSVNPSRGVEPLAIVGIGCRFPGDADNPKKFWDLISNGKDAISGIPEDRWNVKKFYDPAPSLPGHTQARLGGFVKNVESFDPGFFGIGPREAACVDPQQRMLLETAWEALEDAGMPLDPEVGGNIGVYIGISSTDYATAQSDLKDGDHIDMYTPTGGTMSIAANRISYCLNLRGPSLSVDTACSSSLVALHIACTGLWNGETEAALVGGVNFILSPDTYVGFSRMSMLSPDGRCKPFDSRANGFTRGEGAGMVLLKPLSKALADKDRIYALIRGTAVNQDGSDSAGMTMPARSAQEAVIRAACQRAGIDPSQINYVEAHGTGTQVGDPVEASALGTVIGQKKTDGNPLYIGSVKSNIGHLEPGAGIAGLTKAALALYHRTLPPTLNFITPNPGIDFEGLNLQVAATTVALPNDGRSLFAGVNSFGFGGTNGHAVLETGPHRSGHVGHSNKTFGQNLAEIFPVSARSQTALKAMAASFGQALREGGSVNGSSWQDICHTMAVRRFHHPDYRGAVVAQSREDAVACLSAIAGGEMHPNWCGSDEPVKKINSGTVFVFCGQGPQWHAMGTQLLENDPVFRKKMEECDQLIQKLGGWSLLEELRKSEEESRIQDTSFGQPAIFAIQVSLAARWMDWGITPAAVVGHSVGEVAAAHVAGVLNLEDAIQVIFHRGRCMAKAGQGAMLAVGMSQADALALISNYGDKVCLAASNSPTSVTLSGEGETLAKIGKELDRRGIFQKPLRVNYAFHSKQMDPIRDELLASLKGLKPSTAKLPLYSTVSGAATDGSDYHANYWWKNVRQAVLFTEAIEAIAARGYETFLELGPHPVLTGSITDTLRAHGRRGGVFSSLRRKEDERATLLKTVGAMFSAGLPLDWAAICPGNFVTLPGYAWAREHYWTESETHRAYRLGNRQHPFLGENRNGAEPSWEVSMGVRARNLIDDHRVQGRALFPAAGYLEMALEAAKQINGADATCDLEGVEFHKALFMPSPDDPCRMRLIFDPETRDFRIHSEMTGQSGWVKNCSGEILEVPESQSKPQDKYTNFDTDGNPSLPGGEEFDVDLCYRMFEQVGIQYGPKFRGLKKIYRKEGEALGFVKLTADALFPEDKFHLHPALLDSCFHTTLVANPNNQGNKPGATFLPARIERIRLYESVGDEIWSHATLSVAGKDVIVADIRMFDQKGNIVAEIEGFTCHAAGSGAEDPTARWLYRMDLELTPRQGATSLCQPSDYMPTPAHLAKHVKAQGAKMEKWGHLYQEKEPELNHLCREYIRHALSELGWRPKTGGEFTTAALVKKLGVVNEHARVLERYIEILAEDGYFEATRGGWKVRQWGELEDLDLLWSRGISNFPAYHMEYMLLRKMGQQLANLLKGEASAHHLLFEDGSRLIDDVFTRGWSMRNSNRMVGEAVKEIVALAPQGRKVRILEVGAKSGALTEWVIRSLPVDSVQYVYTDPGSRELNKAEERFAEYGFVTYQPLDISISPLQQGFAADSFDIVIAGHALHATGDLGVAGSHLREVLAPGGMLIILETVVAMRWWELVFGMTDGWLEMTDDRAAGICPLVSVDRWEMVLKKTGFKGISLIKSDDQCQAVFFARDPRKKGTPTQQGTIPDSTGYNLPVAENRDQAWLIFADRGGIGITLAESLRSAGHRVVIFYDGIARRKSADDIYFPSRTQELIEAEMASIPMLRGIIHCWSLDIKEPGVDISFDEIENNLLSVVQLVQSVTGGSVSTPPGLWLVTRGAQPDDSGVPMSLAQAPVPGLARTINTEHPTLRCRSIDLQPVAEFAKNSAVDETSLILAELNIQDEDGEILFRGEGRYSPRLVRTPVKRTWREMRDSSKISYGLGIRQLGVIDSMMLTPRPRVEPRSGEIEIKVESGALNFRDVLKALGIYPTEGDEELLLGDECAGRITKIGKGVTGLKVGDRVTSIAMGCFGSHATTLADFAMRCPDSMQLDEAVTLPVTFLTASYALEHLAGIKKGERVLIHAATGGVGLAAIQIAQQVGAEIFATAGSPEKRDFLRGLGVDHILDSRSLAFYDEIRQITNGEGVDIVLNSLAGQAISRSLSLLRDYGRFLEIGKRDIYANTRIGLRAFRKNVSYFAIDLSRTFNDRVPLVRTLLQGLARRFQEGTLKPLPQLVFSQSQIPAAFRAMRQARHIGKVVISFNEKQVPIEFTSEAGPTPVRADGTYLVTGGTSGFGLVSARWLADQGAGGLVLLSRSGATTAEAREAIAEMEKNGTRVLAPRADVCSIKEVGAALQEIEKQGLPPLRGIFHAAMVLDDASLGDQNPERFHRTFAPKSLGSWVLHKLTEHIDLDFFTLFSSINSVIGSPGQANYAAGNVFLEALAHYRKAIGKNGLAINWGHIGETGVASRSEQISERLNRGGFPAMNPRTCVEVKGELIQHGHTHAVVADLDWKQMEGTYIRADKSPRFGRILSEIDKSDSDQDSARARERILGASGEEQLTVMRDYLQNLVARVLRTSPSKLDPNRHLMDLGLDSLMAVELINRIESDLGIGVPSGQLGSQSIKDLGGILLPLLTGRANSPETEAAPKVEIEEIVASPNRVTLDTAGQLKRLNDELRAIIKKRVILTESKNSSSEGSLKIKFCRAEELSDSELLSALRRRFELYSNKNLIGSGSRNRLVTLPEKLRKSLSEDLGRKVPSQVDPADYQIDFDGYDFESSCYHLVIQSQGNLLSYLRLIFEVDGQMMSAREIYDEEITRISKGNLSAEISRLIHPTEEGASSGELLELMRRLGLQTFELVDQLAAQKGVHHLFAQVHPMHGIIYQRNGVLEQKGVEKPCPSVNNAPAVLMHRSVSKPTPTTGKK